MEYLLAYLQVGLLFATFIYTFLMWDFIESPPKRTKDKVGVFVVIATASSLLIIIWPALIAWGFGNFVYQEIRGR